LSTISCRSRSDSVSTCTLISSRDINVGLRLESMRHRSDSDGKPSRQLGETREITESRDRIVDVFSILGIIRTFFVASDVRTHNLGYEIA
jgi:hypothetical protein